MTFLKSLAESFLFFAIKLRRRLQLREQWKKTTTLSFFSPPPFPWLSGTLRPERRFVASSSFAIFFPFLSKPGESLLFFPLSHFVLQFGGAPPACKSIIYAQHYCTTVRNEEMKWGDLISRANGRRGKKKEFSARRCGKSGDADLSKVQQREEKKGGGKMCNRLVLRFFRLPAFTLRCPHARKRQI